MENNKNVLQNALREMQAYEPGEQIWSDLGRKLDALPLQQAASTLPEYEPDEKLWGVVENGLTKSKPFSVWWSAASAAVLLFSIGFWYNLKDKKTNVIFSQEIADARLQSRDLQTTNAQYRLLKSYCETETLVCNSPNYKQLQQEYEKLDEAAQQLQQVIGEYNTEADLVRQFTLIETQKADILNQMAKMI